MERNGKNKIIALSGQPVSGKGTTVKTLVKKLIEQGYKEENIHIEATGTAFRNYFNKVIEFIRNINNKEELMQLAQTEELKKIFESEEYRKIFSSSIALLQQQGKDFSNFTIEDANNMEELGEIRKIIDTLIDNGMKEKGQEINKVERPNEIWIIDSRLAFHNVPEAFSVRLTCKPDIAAKRLMNDTTRGNEDNKYETIEQAKEARENRRLGEQERYMQRYGVDLENPDNYDLIIDTSYSTIEDISETILTCLDYYKDGKYFAKTWASPKVFLPLQDERMTFSKALYTFEEIADSIKENGYLPSQPIDTIEVDGYKYIVEGHHRNFAQTYLGNTLIPYEQIAKDDEIMSIYGGNTARERSKALNISYLRGHEGIICASDPNFKYEDIYPDIVEHIKEVQEEVR